MTVKILPPIKEEPEDYEAIERVIVELFRKEIYLPLMAELGLKNITVKNAIQDLIDAIHSGKIRYSQGRFTGSFNSTLSRELRKIGAEWDRRHGSFAIPQSNLPADVRHAIEVSFSKFKKTAEKIDKKLEALTPAEIAGKAKLEKLFDSTIWKTDKKVQKTLKGITVSPTLTPAQVERVSKEYTQNMQLYIQDFVEKEIVELRKRITEHTLAGVRYESIIEEIRTSYGVSQRKAKFLARQETNLLSTKMKQVRYQDAGVNEYIWGCVKMPHQAKDAPYLKGEVRHEHGILEGKTFSWDNPPIVNQKGERKNPGQDYGCRCFAKPVVRF